MELREMNVILRMGEQPYFGFNHSTEMDAIGLARRFHGGPDTRTPTVWIASKRNLSGQVSPRIPQETPVKSDRVRLSERFSNTQCPGVAILANSGIGAKIHVSY